MREGDRFGAYLLEEKLATGGMAEVFRARREGAAGFSRQVCIKRILPAYCQEREFVEMFIDEARTGAQLRHGNIVAIDDFGEVDGQYYLCMELVSGVDLTRLCGALQRAGRALPVEAAAHVTAEMLRALDYAHRKLGPDGAPLNLVHRDVSPHNVLVSFAGEARLTDFGIAKARTRLHQTTGFVVKGKLAYMAPEQARGHAIDGRADVFALGATAFEALAGRRPFTGANESELVTRLLRGERPALRSLRPDVPPAFEAVVDRMLATSVAERFATAGDGLDALAATGLASGGSRALAAALAFCFPEHASAMHRGGTAGASLPPAPKAAEPGAGEAAATADVGARTLVDPTQAATPRAYAEQMQAHARARPREVVYAAGVQTRVGIGAADEGAAPGHVAEPRGAYEDRTEALGPAWGASTEQASGAQGGAGGAATRTSLRPAGVAPSVEPEQRTRTSSLRPAGEAPPALASQAILPVKMQRTQHRMPAWLLALVGLVGLGVGAGVAAVLLR